MSSKYILFVDATLESHASFYSQSYLFNSWLRSFNDIAELLRFINQITEPSSIEIFIARDHILDDVLPAPNNGQTQTLIETFCHLKTIKHVLIFLPEMDDDIEQQFAKIIHDPRLIKDIISLVNLRTYMCCRGITYLEAKIKYCRRNEPHLIDNLQKNIDDLKEYLGKLIDDRKRELAPIEEVYSNKPSEQAS